MPKSHHHKNHFYAPNSQPQLQINPVSFRKTSRPHRLKPSPTPVKPIHPKTRVAIAPQLSDGCRCHGHEAQHVPTPLIFLVSPEFRGREGRCSLSLIGCLSAGFHSPTGRSPVELPGSRGDQLLSHQHQENPPWFRGRQKIIRVKTHMKTRTSTRCSRSGHTASERTSFQISIPKTTLDPGKA